MLIAVVGLAGAGRHAVAEFLEREHGFTRVGLGDASATDGSLRFASKSDLLQFVTANWLRNYVTLDLQDTHTVAPFEKRPWFLLVSVEAPLLQRWARWRERHADLAASTTLEQFIAADDAAMYGAGSAAAEPEEDADASVVSATDAALEADTANMSLLQRDGVLVSASLPGAGGALASLQSRAHLRIANTFPTPAQLCAHLQSLALPSQHRLRPTWDTYFVSLCTLASLRSNCMKRRVGAVIVRSNRVLSTGYNGTPRGLTNCNEGGCPRCNGSAPCGSNLDECVCLHAEENALLELGRDRGGAQGTVLYCNTCPCLRCAVKIAQTGVQEVVYQLEYSMDGRSTQILAEAGVRIR